MFFSILRMYIKWQYRIGFSLKNPLGYYKLVTNIQNMYVCIYKHKLQHTKLCNQWHKMTEVAINKGYKSNNFSLL